MAQGTTTTSIPAPDELVPLIDSTDLLTDADVLRRRGEADGYLFFRSRIPAEPLLSLRREMLMVLDRHGLLRSDTALDEARADLDEVAKAKLVGGCTDAAYADIQRLELFHRIAHHPSLLEIYAALFDGPVLPHPRNIARVLLPGPKARATPPHQDFIHIQGATQTWTAWFPLGDCPRQLGGLAVLRESHKKGVLAVGSAEGAGGLETMLCRDEDTWLGADYRVGDVLTFPSTTVHRGLPNQMGDRIRLSCDFRYQSALDDIEEKSLRPHRDVLTWDEIYASWESDELKYYWESSPLKMSDWDESVRWQNERICD